MVHMKTRLTFVIQAIHYGSRAKGRLSWPIARIQVPAMKRMPYAMILTFTWWRSLMLCNRNGGNQSNACISFLIIQCKWQFSKSSANAETKAIGEISKTLLGLQLPKWARGVAAYSCTIVWRGDYFLYLSQSWKGRAAASGSEVVCVITAIKNESLATD